MDKNGIIRIDFHCETVRWLNCPQWCHQQVYLRAAPWTSSSSRPIKQNVWDVNGQDWQIEDTGV